MFDRRVPRCLAVCVAGLVVGSSTCSDPPMPTRRMTVQFNPDPGNPLLFAVAENPDGFQFTIFGARSTLDESLRLASDVETRFPDGRLVCSRLDDEGRPRAIFDELEGRTANVIYKRPLEPIKIIDINADGRITTKDIQVPDSQSERARASVDVTEQAQQSQQAISELCRPVQTYISDLDRIFGEQCTGAGCTDSLRSLARASQDLCSLPVAERESLNAALPGAPPPVLAIAQACAPLEVPTGATVILDATIGSSDDCGPYAIRWIAESGDAPGEINEVATGLSSEARFNVEAEYTVYAVVANACNGVQLVHDSPCVITVVDRDGPSGENHPPEPDAGSDQTVMPGTLVTLDASMSDDPDGDPLEYLWRQNDGGPRVDLVNRNTAIARFVAPNVDGQVTLEFEVFVFDDRTLEPPSDTVMVVVTSDCTMACDDGQFCTGVEVCGPDNDCTSGMSPCVDPVPFCRELDDRCVECLTDGHCGDDGFFCNGPEFCNPDGVCESGPEPCPGAVCRELDDRCGCLTHADCNDGQFCNGVDQCIDGSCIPGEVPMCPPGQVCRESDDQCVECLSDGDCPNDNLFCNGEPVCDTAGVCQGGAAPCAAAQICCELNDACVSSSRLHVRVNAAPGGTGDCWDDALNSLQTALSMADASGGQIAEIWVAAGVYRPMQPANPSQPRSATFRLMNGLALYGGFAGSEISLSERNPAANVTTLSGDLNNDDGPLPPSGLPPPSWDENSYHVVTGSGVDATGVLDGFTVTRGRANGPASMNESTMPGDDTGAGILISNGSPTIRSCRVLSNRALAHGGGIACVHSAAPFIDNCVVESNGVDGRLPPGGTATLGSGGGVYCSFGSPATLRNCTIQGNTSLANFGGGGGVFCDQNSNPIIVNTRIWANTAVECGGGIGVRGGSMPQLVNVDLAENDAQCCGGAVCVVCPLPPAPPCPTRPVLTNCTLRSNSAGGNGGGALYGIVGHASLRNCIVWGNTSLNGVNACGPPQIGPEAPQAITLCGGSIDVRNSCVQGGEAAVLLGGNPPPLVAMISAWMNNIMDDPLLTLTGELSAGSPCIDAGNNSHLPADTTDLDNDGNISELLPLDLGGGARRAGSGTPPIVDMGAYERQP